MESGKRKRLLLALAGTALLLLILYLGTAGEREPSYEGRKLSEWIAVYGYAGPRNRAPTIAERDEAAHAIHAIGTNALPYLLEWITYEPGTLRYQILTHQEKFPNWLKNRDVVYQWFFGGLERAYYSKTAFEVLGAQAIPAIPELHRLACTAGQRETQVRAVDCLFNIGPAATAALTNVFATTGILGILGNPTRDLQRLGTNAAPFVPILVEQLKQDRLRDAVGSAKVLGAIKLNPAEVIPALKDRLTDTRPRVRAAAAEALAQFGALAIATLPALTNMLNDPDPETRAAAIAAINTMTGVTSQ